MSLEWNPWCGCRKISIGCDNCHVLREKNLSEFRFNSDDFDMPIRKINDNTYLVQSGVVINVCTNSDFFIEEADQWREMAWSFIKERQDCKFIITTKMIERFRVGLPADWNNGYPNVVVGVSVEDQASADTRIPKFLNTPVKNKIIVIAPILSKIDLESYLMTRNIKEVEVFGESGENSRNCFYDWVIGIQAQCFRQGVSFAFKKTGTKFIYKGKKYKISEEKEAEQAAKADINITPLNLW